MTSPENPFDTSYELPVVSLEIAASLLADVRESGLQETLTLAEARLSTNNPNLYFGIQQFAQGMGLESPEAVRAAYGVMLVTHELLRRQAETDTLNTHFDNPDAT